jgi:hypothetical protein
MNGRIALWHGMVNFKIRIDQKKLLLSHSRSIFVDVVSPKKGETFSSLYKSQLLSIHRLMHIIEVLQRWIDLLQVLFFHQTLANIYILSSYFYGPQRINFALDFLSRNQQVVSHEWQLIPNNKTP